MTPPQDIPTPPFVLWSLQADCLYREEAEPADTHRVERILRPLRASAEALAEGRCCENVCVTNDWSAGDMAERTTGFLLTDTLIPFGGVEVAEQTCGACPANAAMPSEQQPRWAGCHGMLVADDCEALQSQLSQTLRELEAELSPENPFPPARLAWNRLFMRSPFTGEQLLWHAAIWQRHSDSEAILSGVDAFGRAIAAATRQGLPLHVRAYPPAIRTGKQWQVPAHCKRCSAVREERSAACPICQTSEAAEPARRRLAKGERPYWQLTRFLGQPGAEAFLRRYAEQRSQ